MRRMTAVLVGVVLWAVGQMYSTATVQRPTWLLAHRSNDEADVKAAADKGANGVEFDVMAPGAQKFALDLIGTDRPGIVREITDVLAAHAVNIDTLRTETRDAPMSGGRLFEATAVLEVPADTDLGALRVALEKLANELMVDITLDTSG